MNILFLDIDGVLNNRRWYSDSRRLAEREAKLASGEDYRRSWDIDPENVRWLNSILNADEDLQIVVSSTWRLGMTVGDLDRFLGLVGVERGRVIGKTGVSESRMRYIEVSDWLKKHPEVERWAAVDDDGFDMKQLGEHFFWIDSDTGLTEERAKSVVEYLKGK